jgi:osmotically inducible protein OsmC
MFYSASGALRDQVVTWAARTESSNGMTSPEELIAAAHASCYSMAFSHYLSSNFSAPDHLQVTSTVGLAPKEGGGMEVKYSHLVVRGKVRGLDQDGFQTAANEAEKGCPISNLIRNNAEITVEATLEG